MAQRRTPTCRRGRRRIEGIATLRQEPCAGLRRERAGARRLTDAIYGGEALYTRPEARRLGEGSGDELKEREAAVLLDPAARVDADGVLSAGVTAEVAETAERSGR